MAKNPNRDHTGAATAPTPRRKKAITQDASAPSGPPCPQPIRDLVDRFAQHRDSYRAAQYNETQARREFIDPLFKQLGWDIDNLAGHAEAYKDVIHEDAIKIGGATKAPDYCFRIGGVRKFFVEAKKPGVNIKTDSEPAYQLRRYAWSAKLPLSILTDFEEFAVYDCRIKPSRTDKASVGRILYLSFDQFIDKWPDIANIFSKDAILKGSFDKYAESNKRKRGTAEVDDAFLEEIEGWRDALAKNFALRNPDLSVRDLNFAVGRTIDRIIFLRMCEDRSIEPYGQLQALLNGTDVYARMGTLFRQADDKYNAGLFYFRQEPDRGPPDELTLALALDDKVLKDIISRLYYPDSPYEFSMLSADILGQVYEQFLGKVIRLTAGHRAKIEEKPEVRKAGGVYYTPTYIVDYIVKHTVGNLLEGKTPRDVGPDRETKTGKARKLAKGAKMLRILDPACGSGSFLLGAYQYLLDWHRDWYVSKLAPSDPNPDREGGASVPLVRESVLAPTEGGIPSPDPNPARKEAASAPSPDDIAHARDRVYQGAGGQWRLTIREKKRILLNNIYGVDIDPQAVEVTKLSLLLRVLEGESAETVGSTLRLFHERALPDLSNNIKCGNSLIGPDFYEGKQLDMFDEEERYRINAFDWEREFPEVFQSRARKEADGADRDSGFDAVIGNPPWGQKEIEKEATIGLYLRNRFRTVTGIFDLFRPFVEQGLHLISTGATFGMVLPDIVLLKDYVDTRKFVLENMRISEIDWWGMAFEDAVIDAATIIGCKSEALDGHIVLARIHQKDSLLENQIPQADFWQNERLTFNLHLTKERRAILQHLAQFPRLGESFEMHEGVHSGNIRDELFVDRRLDSSCRELLFGRNEIAPYTLRWNGRFVRLSALPAKRSSARYANAGQPDWYEREKLLVRRTGDYVLAALDLHGRYASNNFFIVFPKKDTSLSLDVLCAILNSQFMTWYFRAIEPRQGRVFAELKIKHLERFPLPPHLLSGKLQEFSHLATQRRDLAERVLSARSSHSRTTLERAVAQLDSAIHSIVFHLYEIPPQHQSMIEKEIIGERTETESAG